MIQTPLHSTRSWLPERQSDHAKTIGVVKSQSNYPIARFFEVSDRHAIVVPKLVGDAGDRATKRFANFFGSIDNDNTRAAYQRACHCFFAWCETRGITALIDIEPIHVGAYLKSMADGFEKPTIKQHLAAIRMLFDYLVTGQVIALNPAHAVRGPKHVIKRGKTPMLTSTGPLTERLPSDCSD